MERWPRAERETRWFSMWPPLINYLLSKLDALLAPQ